MPDCPTSGQTVAPQPLSSWRTWSDKALEDTELSGARKMGKLVWNFSSGSSDCWENGPLLFYKFDSRMGESANSFAICPMFAAFCCCRSDATRTSPRDQVASRAPHPTFLDEVGEAVHCHRKSLSRPVVSGPTVVGKR